MRIINRAPHHNRKRNLEKEEEKKMNGWLYGWKEIGDYIGCSDQTIKNYVKKFRFPVHRMPETKKPIAQPREIDQWIKTFKK